MSWIECVTLVMQLLSIVLAAFNLFIVIAIAVSMAKKRG